MESKTLFRVGAAGLDPRDARLIEIVFRHSQYNRYAFVLMPDASPSSIDILIANPSAPAGLDALAAARACGRELPAIVAVPRGTVASARHAISIDRLTLQLLPILNRVVEHELLPTDVASSAPPAPDPAPSAPPPVAAPAPLPPQSTQPSPSWEPPAPAAARMSMPAADAAPAPPVTVSRVAPPGGAPRNLVPFPAQPAAQPPRLKVLAVDDSPTVRRQLAYALERLGLACVTEDSAEAALERLEQEHVDLMLVDVELPDMDGYKLTRTVKRDRRFRRLPVVMLTSRASAFDLARGALAGCESYLAKPVPLRTLEETVIRVLRQSLAIDDLGGLLPGFEPADGAAAGTDPSTSTVRRAAGPS